MCRVRLEGEDAGVLPHDWTIDVLPMKDGSYLIQKVVDVDGNEYGRIEEALTLAEILSSSSRPEVRGRR